MSVKKNLDYIIVLGAHVDGTRMTLALLERARRALLYLEENTYKEIGEILGITETNVATKISRIKEKLKQKFNKLQK